LSRLERHFLGEGSPSWRAGSKAAPHEPVLTTLAQAGGCRGARPNAAYFTGELAHAAFEAACDIAIAAKRSIAL
jgi:hypothetical protein